VRHRVAARSYDRYAGIVKGHLIPALGGVKLTSLRPDQVQRCYSKLIDAGLAPATVHKVHAVLHSALKHAMRMRQLSRNPSDDAALPKIRRREMTALSDKQVGKLLAAAKGTPVATPLLALVTLGMRRGELLGLTWPDVDSDEGRVSIRRTLEESSAGVTFKEPKTARGARTIALPQVTVEALREHRKAQCEMRLRVGPASRVTTSSSPAPTVSRGGRPTSRVPAAGSSRRPASPAASTTCGTLMPRCSCVRACIPRSCRSASGTPRSASPWTPIVT